MTYSLIRSLRLGLQFVTLFGALNFALLSTAAAADRIFTLGTARSPDVIVPYKQMSGESDVLRNLMYPPILYVQRDGRIRCNLCKEVPSAELRKGAEPGTYAITLELKKDLKWGDGSTITPQDVKFTLETMAKASFVPGEQPVLPIRRIEIDKDEKRKITLILRHRRSDAFQIFAISLLPSQFAKEIEALAKQPAQLAELVKAPGFAYGPYRVATVEGNAWQLVRNEKTHWEKKPDQAIQLRFYPDSIAMTEALKRNEIDQSDEFSWAAYEKLRSEWPDLSSKYEIAGNPGNDLQVLLINLHSPILVNPQLRQALFYAINREKWNTERYKGLAEVGVGILSDSFSKRLEIKHDLAYKPKLAAQIFEQNGWMKTSDAGIRALDGQKLSLTLTCPRERHDEEWIASLKSDLNAVGVRLDVDQPEEAEYKKKVMGERRFKDLACATWTLPPLSIPNNIFHSLAIPKRENNYFGSNYSGWDQHVVDRLLDGMLRETDLVHFTRQFGRLEKQFMSDMPGIPLVFEPRITLTLKSPLSQPSEELSRVLQNPTRPKKL